MNTPKNDHKLSRRVLFAGAGTAGAVAAVAAALPAVQPAAPVAEAPRQPPERGGGYVLSEHVKHYYRSARV
ncbi:formate dehydrogenase [Ottowia sp. SB7-C50]|mgnify:FL=1|jgi:hypothetical protein|uniref:formate dehydrogenase n=1 Tax=Ottowia sp. SB7-C50 TaxID=3081231 RepID=UPI0029531B83|nr:formate dehydrogenase [Ottowia sp. SB7-C50]WOP14864.1 formate dehydrogenase [Ottowia sp. SB7-C50]